MFEAGDLLEFYGRRFTISPSKVEGHVLLLFGDNGSEGFLSLEPSEAAASLLQVPLEVGQQGIVDFSPLQFAVVVLHNHFSNSQVVCEGKDIKVKGAFRWGYMDMAHIEDTPAAP